MNLFDKTDVNKENRGDLKVIIKSDKEEEEKNSKVNIMERI